MRYLRNTINAQLGDKLLVNVSKPTRILIMTGQQFKKYKNNVTFTYFGGHKDASYEFEIPKSGSWTVVVEKGPYHKPINIEAKIKLEKALKTAEKHTKKRLKSHDNQETSAELIEE